MNELLTRSSQLLDSPEWGDAASMTPRLAVAFTAAATRITPTDRKEPTMLWTLVIVLVALWLLGLVTSYTLGGVIHVLLVLAVIVVILNLLQGRRAMS